MLLNSDKLLKKGSTKGSTKGIMKGSIKGYWLLATGYWLLAIYLEGYWAVLVHEAVEKRVEAGGSHGQEVEGDVQEVVVTAI